MLVEIIDNDGTKMYIEANDVNALTENNNDSFLDIFKKKYLVYIYMKREETYYTTDLPIDEVYAIIQQGRTNK